MKQTAFLLSLAAFLALCGFSCHKSLPTADFYASLTARAVWPHTGSGTSATLTAPLRVRITSLAHQEARRSAAWSAVQDWQRATGNRVSFTLIPDSPEKDDGTAPADEDILITQADLGPMPGGNGYKLGWTDVTPAPPATAMKSTDPPYVLTHATITISNTRLSVEHVAATVRHEAAHSLGLLDHSPDSRDLMYATGYHDGVGVSVSDVKTLGMVYGG